MAEAGEPVPWTKPGDLTYDPAGPLPPLGAGFSKADKFLCYEGRPRPGFNACFADGSVRFLMADRADERSLRSLLTRNGDEPATCPGSRSEGPRLGPGRRAGQAAPRGRVR